MQSLRLIISYVVLATTALAQPSILIDTPMPPPAWALLQQEVRNANAAAIKEFHSRYFDSRGFLKCVVRWGGDDGPDDAIECCADWTLLYSLGCDSSILDRYQHAYDGHIQQYTEARTIDVPLAREGMYFKEFPTMFDWIHLGEGMIAFSMQGLCNPDDSLYRSRAKRFADFYLPDGTPEPNYDPQHRIIRSMFNGSRGPLLRKATALDWAGDPIDVAGRFDLRHGEENYEQMLEHFIDYNDVVGDHPQNLCTTSLALNAYALNHEPQYRDWIIEYVDAWMERTKQNGGIIPTNIGLDGTPGGAADGKWYGGVYGWGFSVIVPQTGGTDHRNTHQLGIAGFGNAFLLTGDHKYLDTWRSMIDAVNQNSRMIDGKKMYPRMYGDDGWYAFSEYPYSYGALDIYYWSMRPADRRRVQGNAWINFLEGEDAEYPVRAFQSDLAGIRDKVQAMRQDTTTPDSRLADDPLRFNPATATNLMQLMQGGMYPGRYGGPLHSRLRFFDPVARRSGLSPNIASLVTRLTDDETEVTLINTDQLNSHEAIVQLGAYGEHHCENVEIDGTIHQIDGTQFTVHLNPGCGARLTVSNQRYVHQPTLAFPWSHTAVTN
jgi:hypothetical protein